LGTQAAQASMYDETIETVMTVRQFMTVKE